MHQLFANACPESWAVGLAERNRSVRLHFFTVPALDSRAAADELNQFLASNRVVAVERELVAMASHSYWAICVTVAMGPGPLPDALKAAVRRIGDGAAGRIDYKQVLSDADFAVFSELRKWRKTVAERDGIPLYSVFTNEQLAEIVRRRPDTLMALSGIEGIGPARLERYGPDVLSHLASASGASNA